MVDTLIDTEHLDTKISPEKDTDPSETSEKVGLNHKLNSTGIVYRDYISDSSEINSDSSSLFNDPSLRQSTGDLTLISKAVSIDTHSNSATPGSSIIVPAERNPVSDLLRSPSSTKKHKHRHSIPDMSTLEYYSHRTSLDDLTTTCEEKLVIQPSQEIIPEEEKEPRHLPAPEINPKARFITMEEALSIEEDSVDTPLEKQMNEIKSLEQRRSIKRLNAIKELMETEETYSRDLGILCTHFFAIIQQATCITPEEIDILVRNAMDIYVFQEKFTEALMDAHGEQEAEKNGIFYKGNLKQIATCFVEWAPKFDIYLDYCVRQDHAASVYNELLQTNLEFSNLIERLHTFHRVSFGFSRLKFDDYMITPFQRIFRYRLLLQSITKATQKDTEEYEILSKAQNIVHAIATKINNEKSKMEAKRKTALFLSRLDSDWCLPKRWFSTLGVCTLIGTLEVRSMIDNKPKRIGCALFDHYMIMAKAKKHKQYEPRYWFPLRKFDIEDIPHLEGSMAYSWLLHSDDSTLELSALCELEKTIWMDALSSAIQESKRLYANSVDSNEYLLEQLFVSSFDQQKQKPMDPIEFPMPNGSTSFSQSAIFNKQSSRSSHRSSHPVFSTQEFSMIDLSHPIDHVTRSPGLRSQSSIGDLRDFFSNSVSEKWTQRKFNQYHTRCKSVDTKFDDVCTTPILTARANSMHRHGSNYVKKRKMIPSTTPNSTISLIKTALPQDMMSPVFHSPSTSFSESCPSACSSRRPSIGNNTESMMLRLAQRHPSIHRSSSIKSATGPPSVDMSTNSMVAAGLLPSSKSTHFFGRMVEKLGQIGTPGKLRRNQMMVIQEKTPSTPSKKKFLTHFLHPRHVKK